MTYFLLASFLLALVHGQQVLQNSTDALNICIQHLVPSLFLGMVCIRYLYENGVKKTKLTYTNDCSHLK